MPRLRGVTSRIVAGIGSAGAAKPGAVVVGMVSGGPMPGAVDAADGLAARPDIATIVGAVAGATGSVGDIGGSTRATAARR